MIFKGSDSPGSLKNRMDIFSLNKKINTEKRILEIIAIEKDDIIISVIVFFSFFPRKYAICLAIPSFNPKIENTTMKLKITIAMEKIPYSLCVKNRAINVLCKKLKKIPKIVPINIKNDPVAIF